MSTCRWCTPGGSSTTQFLRSYASKTLSPEDLAAANDDLCYCLECVVEYHKARDELPCLQEILWELETSRLIYHFEKFMKTDIEEDDELFIVDDEGETKLSGYTGPDFENNLRVPLLEILKYPYLLLHERVSEYLSHGLHLEGSNILNIAEGEHCVEALCKMEQVNFSFQVFDKHPGIYLLLVHPSEVIRRWAILTARNLGKVDRDDYYDLQEVFTCLFKVIELGLFDSPDIYSSSMIEKGKLVLLPSHLYDTTNYKNYWLGICMLLTVLEEQAMDSLLLGPDKQNDFMQSILHTMEKQTDDESADPFWPALHCFMVILDQLGSKVWGQLIDPVQAFQTIINNASYNNEIKNIRNSSRRTKSELESDYEDMVTCSQIVYNYNTEKPKKDTGWKTAICPDYCPNMYEDMQTLANVLQSDIGQDMRVHNSTFLWFIPFVQSLMDLKDLGVAYIVEVIHYLCSEIKNFLNEGVQQCDKVSEFFILILVSVVELHRNKKCLHLLWVSSQEWVEAVVKCAKLPTIAFMRSFEKAPGNCPRVTSTISSPAFNSVQHACVQLIRSLLREGYQLGQQIVCKQFLDKLNLLLRGNLSLGWQLSSRETQELQMCLKQVIRSIKDRSPNASIPVENSMICTNLPTIPTKQEKVTAGDRGQTNIQHRNSLSPSFSLSSRRDEACQESPSPRRTSIWKEDYREMSFNDTKECVTAEYLLTDIKKEPHDKSFQECEHPDNSGATKTHKDSHKNGNNHEVQGNQNKNSSILKQCFNTSPQVCDFKSHAILERDETEVRMPVCLSAQPCSNSHEDIHNSIGKDGSDSPNSCPKFKIEAGKLTNFKAKVQKTAWATKLLQLMKQSASTSEVDQLQSRSESLCTSKDGSRDQGVIILNKGETSVNFNTSDGSENKQEKSMNSTFQTRLLSIKKESNGTMLDISNSFKKEVGLEESESGGEDNIPRDLKKKRSLSGESSSLPKSLLNKDLNTEIPDQGQSNSGILRPSRGDHKDQKVSILRTGETSANVNTPSSSENKAEILRNVPLISPFSIKCESTDRLFDFSRYFKRENDSEEKSNSEDNVAIACDSIKKKSGASTLTDSKVDRHLDKLSSAAYAKDVNLPVDLSQERSIHLCDIKRKVKGAVRSSIKGQSNESSSDTDCPNNEIIIISDSSSDEEKKLDIKKQIKKNHECVCPEKQPLTSGYVSDNVNKKEQLKTRSSLLPCEEYSSQYFEFETEDDIFSVWQDSQIDDERVNQAQEQDSNLMSASNCASDSLQLVDHTNDWGYDTDYISDDVIEKAAEAVEKQVGSISDHKKVSKTDTKAKATFQEPVIKGNATDQSEYFTQPNAVAEDHAKNTGLMEPKASTSSIPLSSKLVIKKNTLSPGKSLAKFKSVRTALRSPRRMSLKTVQNKKFPQTSSRNSEPCRSTTPAVVPPKKVRQCPEPTSAVVKLGLKKAPRKAFEYSQRSLDSLAELRSYGKAAGAVQTSQKQKTKLIAPQYLVVKHNRKMLSCQDRQFLRQTRPKQGGRGKNRVGSSEGRSKKITKKSDSKLPVQHPVAFDPASAAGTNEKQKERIAKQISCRSSNDGKKVGKSISSEREEVQTTHISKRIAQYGSIESNMKIEENNMAVPVLQIESCFSSSLTEDGKNEPADREYVVPLDFVSTPNLEGATLEESKPKLHENSNEDDLFLTQLDPVDMEMCSQMENVGDIIANEKEPVDMEVVAAESLLQNEPLSIVKCKYKDCTEKMEKTGEYCSKHSATDCSDHPFVKPGLPLPFKPAKPSTAKIFSSNSSSRSARLSKDLENISEHSLPSKAKSSLTKSTVSKTENLKSVSAENQIFRTPSFSSSLRPQNSSNVLRPQNMQINSTSSFPNRSASGVHSGQERGLPSFPQANALVTQQRDHSIFVTEILKWNYEMFVNFSQFGLPHILLQSIMVSVPVIFQGYNDYFNTFFPLMMLNAFETLAQEWIENQKTKEKNCYHLHLQSFRADLNQADFTAYIRESDLAKQFHPKDDDLIFLVVPEKQNTFAEETERDSRLVYHVGFVTRFSRASLRETKQNEQHVVCHLSIQTRGNLSYYINQQVKCVVISSLVTTQRKFRGLLLLSRSPLAKPIINPSYADFCPRDLNVASESTTSYMREYNADQKKAIETAYAMVKEHPRLPRICLIHGPPGTGKSKTIVGLLYRILTERSGNENPAQNLNAKIKRNRVLVCAPSNAAVDELMKKIIVEFKEKCQNINRPLGNCGDINLVRLGPEKSISSDVQRFSLDSQVKHRMDGGQPGRDQDIHRKNEALDRQLDMLKRQLAMNRCEKREKRQKLEDEIVRLSKERQQLTSQLKKVRGRSQEVQASIILESHIICCTLSTSGGFLLESAFRRQGLDPFSCVIVDEVSKALSNYNQFIIDGNSCSTIFGRMGKYPLSGQSCEVENLIPLTHRCSKLVLVGDPKQLPPTVISMKAQEYGYDQSMMARLHKHLEDQVQQNVIGKLPVMQLTVQYRMHPDICLFPSNYIYGRTLKTDRATEEIRCSSDWPFQPYLVFDVADGHEKRDNDSFANPQEVKLVMEIMKLIKEKKNDIGFRQIGIITPYSAQKKMIQQELDREFGKNRVGEVDTVDGFQGRQKDCIIVTCVRANSTQGSIGFLASLQRLNVTITRAKFSLFILGRLTTLMENKDWNELIQDAQRRGAIIKTCDKSYKKDSVKILKLKPTLQRPLSYPPSTALSEKTARVQACLGSDGRNEVTNRKSSNDSRKCSASAGPSAQGSGAVRQPLESQALGSKGVTIPTLVKAAVQPAVRERPRDPRLARRAEATGKEQASKNSNSSSALSNPGVTSARGPDTPTAHWSQVNTVQPTVSKAEDSNKHNKTVRQTDVPFTVSHGPRQDHDWRVFVPSKEARAVSEEDQKSQNEWSKDKDYRNSASRRTSEHSPGKKDLSEAKRRKVS